MKGLQHPVLRRLVRPRTVFDKVEDVLRHMAFWFFTLLFLVVVVGVPVLLGVTSTYGLGDTVRKKAEQLLGGHNYEVHLRRVLFSPVSGFELEGLEVRDRTPQRRLVVSANRISVSPNMDSLLRGKPRLDKIMLRDATLDIPLGPDAEPRLSLDHARALILSPGDQLRVQDASFVIKGIRVGISGTFLNPLEFSPRPVSTGGPGGAAKTIDSIQRLLGEIHWEETPSLEIEAGGDLADVESLSVNRAEFTGGAGRWRDIPFRKILLKVSYADRLLHLEQCDLEDGKGALQGVGTGDFRKNHAEVECSGSLDPAPVVSAFASSSGWIFHEPMHLDGSLQADWGEGKTTLDGMLQLSGRDMDRGGIAIKTFSAGVAYRQGSILIRDLTLAGNFGNLTADLMIAPGDNRLRLDAALFPAPFASLAKGKEAEALGAMDFKEPLVIRFEGGMPGRDPMQLSGSGSLSLGKASMRGSEIDGLSATVRVGEGVIDFKDILVRMDGGQGRGEFLYDYGRWEGRYPEVRTTLDPVRIMTWIDPRIADGLRPYRFNAPPEVVLTGKVGLRDPEKNNLRVVMNAPRGLKYTLIGKELPFGPTSGTILLRGQKLAIDIPKSRLFDGDVALKADVSVLPGDSRYGASVHLEHVDFRNLTKLYFGYDESGGTITGDYAFRAVGGDDLSMSGSGNLHISDGNVLAMPVLGPLSLLMGEVIPGFGYQTARDATSDFSVENGVITTRDLLIKGKGFSMIGNGTIHYLEDRMNMNIRLNAQGAVGIVTWPVSKIFEYESVGSAKSPKWRPKLLPKIGGGAPSSSQGSSSPTP